MTAQPKLCALTRFGYFPLMAFGVNGVAIASIFSGGTPVAIAIAILLSMIAALALTYASERILPYCESWNRDRGDTRRDLVHFVVNESMSMVPLLIVPIFVMAAPVQASPRWPGHLPLLLQLLICLLIFDLGQNLFHRLAHVWQPLWRLHAVHHEVERMYGLNGIMKHPIYQALSAVVSIGPLVLLGMPKEFSLALVFMSFTQLLLQHSNTDYVLGPFRRVFATAEVHRFHHLRGVAGDVNFSLFFSFYDHLFRRAYFEHRSLESSDIGLEYLAYPQSWWGQMKAPFQKFEANDAEQPRRVQPELDNRLVRLGGEGQGA